MSASTAPTLLSVTLSEVEGKSASDCTGSIGIPLALEKVPKIAALLLARSELVFTSAMLHHNVLTNKDGGGIGEEGICPHVWSPNLGTNGVALPDRASMQCSRQI